MMRNLARIAFRDRKKDVSERVDKVENRCGRVFGWYVKPSERGIFESLEESFVFEDAIETGEDSGCVRFAKPCVDGMPV